MNKEQLIKVITKVITELKVATLPDYSLAFIDGKMSVITADIDDVELDYFHEEELSVIWERIQKKYPTMVSKVLNS